MSEEFSDNKIWQAIVDIKQCQLATRQFQDEQTRSWERLYKTLETNGGILREISGKLNGHAVEIEGIKKDVGYAVGKVHAHVEGHWKWFTWITGSGIAIALASEKIKAFLKRMFLP